MISNGSGTAADEQGKQCALCGAEINVHSWHVATTSTTADGELLILPFCSETCRNNWED